MEQLDVVDRPVETRQRRVSVASPQLLTRALASHDRVRTYRTSTSNLNSPFCCPTFPPPPAPSPSSSSPAPTPSGTSSLSSANAALIFSLLRFSMMLWLIFL